MKSYIENKNFLPAGYIKNMNLEIQKREKVDCRILFIICIAILPHSFKILDSRNKNLERNSISNYNNESKYSFEESKNDSMNNSLEYINEITECDLNNGSGEIYIQGKDRLTAFINNKKIIINNIEGLDEDKFRLQINEK